LVLDLTKSSYAAGKFESCDIVFDKNSLDPKRYVRISKLHFTISCDVNDPDVPVILFDSSSNGTFVNLQLVGKNKRRIIRSGDEISILHPDIKVFKFVDNRSCAEKSKKFPPEVTQKYFISKILGQGACGVVWLTYQVNEGGQFAMKEVKKYGLSMGARVRQCQDPSKIDNEVRIMRQLQHPCCIKLLDNIDAGNQVYMFLEYCPGGDLLSRIIDNKYLQEPLSKFYFYQLCHAIQYLHLNEVTHRDLKPDNILLMGDDEETLLKVSDFGLSKDVAQSDLRTICGTPLYVAPEILESKFNHNTYSKKVDIWSLGVVLFTMLSGTLPFSNDYGSPATEQIRCGRFAFRSGVWRKVSDTARKLVVDLLQVDPDKRPSIDELIKTTWLQERAVISRAHSVMQLDENDIDDVTLVSMTISDEEASPKEPPHKRPRLMSPK
jgi:serine/threonine-protein kinase Chk2